MTQPIDPVLLSALCRYCSDNPDELATSAERMALEAAGIVSTEQMLAYLVRALRLSERRGKWLEARLACRRLIVSDELRMAEERAKAAYEKAGGVV